MEKRNPERHSELHDPKLPVIHAGCPGNGASQHRSDLPLPQTSATESL